MTEPFTYGSVRAQGCNSPALLDLEVLRESPDHVRSTTLLLAHINLSRCGLTYDKPILILMLFNKYFYAF
jgi:hypothetical protein